MSRNKTKPPAGVTTFYSDEVLAWWVEHMDNKGCNMCPSTTESDNPKLAAWVRREWNARGRPKGRGHVTKKGKA